MTDQPRPEALASKVRHLESLVQRLITAHGPPALLFSRAHVPMGDFYSYLDQAGEFIGFSVVAPIITHDSVRVEVTYSVPSGTTVTLRLFFNGDFSDTVTLVGDGGSHSVAWAWRPGWENSMGRYGATQVLVYAERTVGSGVFALSLPWAYLAPGEEINATDGGDPIIDV